MTCTLRSLFNIDHKEFILLTCPSCNQLIPICGHKAAFSIFQHRFKRNCPYECSGCEVNIYIKKLIKKKQQHVPFLQKRLEYLFFYFSS